MYGFKVCYFSCFSTSTKFTVFQTLSYKIMLHMYNYVPFYSPTVYLFHSIDRINLPLQTKFATTRLVVKLTLKGFFSMLQFAFINPITCLQSTRHDYRKNESNITGITTTITTNNATYKQ